MIVVSLLLILVAVALLVLGLAGGSSVLLIGSIAASLLAAVALVVGARQAAAARSTASSLDDERISAAGDEVPTPIVDGPRTARTPARTDGAGDAGRRRPAGRAVAAPSRSAAGRSRRRAGGRRRRRRAADRRRDPPDEPAGRSDGRPPIDGAARLAADVRATVLVDRRPAPLPRVGCVHLLGRRRRAAAGERGGRARLHAVRPLRAGQRAARRRPPGLAPTARTASRRPRCRSRGSLAVAPGLQ